MKNILILITIFLISLQASHAQFGIYNEKIKEYEGANATEEYWVETLIPNLIKTNPSVDPNFEHFLFHSEFNRHYMVVVFKDKNGDLFDIFLLKHNYWTEANLLRFNYGYSYNKYNKQEIYTSGWIDFRTKRNIVSIERTGDILTIDLEGDDKIVYDFTFKEKEYEDDITVTFYVVTDYFSETKFNFINNYNTVEKSKINVEPKWTRNNYNNKTKTEGDICSH